MYSRGENNQKKQIIRDVGPETSEILNGVGEVEPDVSAINHTFAGKLCEFKALFSIVQAHLPAVEDPDQVPYHSVP